MHHPLSFFHIATYLLLGRSLAEPIAKAPTTAAATAGSGNGPSNPGGHPTHANRRKSCGDQVHNIHSRAGQGHAGCPFSERRHG